MNDKPSCIGAAALWIEEELRLKDPELSRLKRNKWLLSSFGGNNATSPKREIEEWTKKAIEEGIVHGKSEEQIRQEIIEQHNQVIKFRYVWEK